jgi:OOP family OmpA-OmpF porin
VVNFGFNSINVEAQYGEQLDQISEQIKGTNSKAVIEGHTDNVGSDQSNKVLSMDRGIVVKRELRKRGVEGADLQVVGYGEEQPVATNDTEEGRKQNRRVEVKVYDK